MKKTYTAPHISGKLITLEYEGIDTRHHRMRQENRYLFQSAWLARHPEAEAK